MSKKAYFACVRSTSLCLPILLTLILAGFAGSTRAAVKTWDGSSSGFWNVAANWAGGVIPANGDDLVFPSTALQFTITNNITNLRLNSITFNTGSGYIVRGNPLTLTNGIAAQQPSPGVNSIENTITNAGTQTFNCVNAGASLIINGLITGNGGLTKTGNGRLLLAGAVNNTYTGTTTVNAGTLELNDTSAATAMVPGDLVIGDGAGLDTLLLTEGNQIADSAAVTINTSGLLNLNGANETIGALTIDGGDITTGLGTLTLGGNVTVNFTASAATISGNLNLGGTTRTFTTTNGNPALTISAAVNNGGITKNGSGNITLAGNNTYAGLTTINAGFILVGHANALGSSAAGTVLNSNGRLTLLGVVVPGESLTNNSASTVLQASGASGWGGDIVLNAELDFQILNGTCNVSGVISGSADITKTQPGTLRFSGAADNTYFGVTYINDGVLELGKPVSGAVGGEVVVGDGIGADGSDVLRLLANSQVDVVTVNSSGLFDLNGFNEVMCCLTLNGGGDVETGAGTLTMGTIAGTITVNPGPESPTDAATISGNLAVSGTGFRTFTVNEGALFQGTDCVIDAVISGPTPLIKNGPGEMTLLASNTFSGTLTINDGGVLLFHNDAALGSTTGATIINSNGFLQFISVDIANEPLTNNGTGTALFVTVETNSWSGPIVANTTLQVDVLSSRFLTISGPISGAGGVTKNSGGILEYAGGTANSYAGITTVNAGTLVLAKTIPNGAMTNDLVVGDGAGGGNSDVARTEVGAQLPNSVGVTVNSSGRMEFNINESFGSLAGSGNVTLNAPIDTGFDNTSTSFSGVIAGAGGLEKSGTGTMTLSGNNTYAGGTTIANGTLLVNGSQPQSDVIVQAAGILGGIGSVGNINNLIGGVVAPGTSPGLLTCSNVNFSGASSDFTVELNGPTFGTEYDVLSVHGTNNLGGSTLNVLVGAGFAPVEGQPLTILFNDGVEAINGTFAGLAEGAIVSDGALKFRISYVGLSGNDITLTLTNPPLVGVAGTVFGGNGNSTIDPNECNHVRLVITNTSGTPITDITAKISSLTPGVAVTQPDSAYPDIPINGKGTNSTPFQIATLPNFLCSSNIDLLLTVSSSIGDFATLFALPSGFAGAPVRFNNNVNFAIPDSGSVTSTVNVVGITTPVQKVTVSLHVTHTSVEDLDIFLMGPDGATINLTSDNGGTADDYGTDCVDNQRTGFDDLAGSSIIGQSAPFVGTFSPEQPLFLFHGKSGAEVNGTWRLIVTDDSGGGTGTLRCWSLFVSPTDCASGGGYCQTCPGIFTNSITTNDLARPVRIERTGIPSACGLEEPCVEYTFGAPYNYDVYTFTNDSGGPACIRVILDTPCADALSVEAYLNSHNTNNLCANFLGDMGYTPSLQNATFSFSVPAGATYVIVVTSLATGIECDYTLVVDGACPPPSLNITKSGSSQVVLDWPTSAAGYLLESTNHLAPGASTWQPVSSEPVVIDSRFHVTNGIVGTNRYYWLRKPLP